MDLSVDEILETLKRSRLPTLVVEGGDDVIVYRRLEERLSDRSVSVFPVGGRTKILELLKKIEDLPRREAIAFAIDLDLWVITGVPVEFAYDRMVCTTGYSIENDAYHDCDFESLLTASERQQFQDEVTRFCHWYALAVDRLLRGLDERIDVHPSAFLDSPDKYAAYVKLREGEAYPHLLGEQVVNEYKRLLRGKSLMALLLRHLAKPGRAARHTRTALIERAAVQRGPLVERLFESIASLFPIDPSASA